MCTRSFWSAIPAAPWPPATNARDFAWTTGTAGAQRSSVTIWWRITKRRQSWPFCSPGGSSEHYYNRITNRAQLEQMYSFFMHCDIQLHIWLFSMLSHCQRSSLWRFLLLPHGRRRRPPRFLRLGRRRWCGGIHQGKHHWKEEWTVWNKKERTIWFYCLKISWNISRRKDCSVHWSGNLWKVETNYVHYEAFFIF